MPLVLDWFEPNIEEIGIWDWRASELNEKKYGRVDTKIKKAA